jgi:hypothetical protein
MHHMQRRIFAGLNILLYHMGGGLAAAVLPQHHALTDDEMLDAHKLGA